MSNNTSRIQITSLRLLILMPLLVLATACVTPVPDQYQWGIFEDHVYADYAQPGARTPQDAAQMLEEDISNTIDAGGKVPPGAYAHLGYLYYLTGNQLQARDLLQRERETYPESTVFIQTLLDNLGSAVQ